MDFGSGVPECTGKLRFVSTKFELWKPKIFKYVCCLFFILLGCFFREQLLSSYLRQLSFIFPKFWEFETFSLPSFCIFRHPCRYSPFIFFSSLFDLVLAKIWIRLKHAHNRTTWWSNDPNAESLIRVSIPAIKIIKTVTRSLPSTGFDYWAAHVGWTANQNIRLLPEPMSLPINDLS